MAGRPSSAQVRVEVHGLEELNRAWPVWERQTEHALDGALLHVASLTRDVLRLRVPVLTGRFRASSRTQRVQSANKLTARLSEGEGLEYGSWLEYGKRKRGAGPKSGRYIVPTARRQKRLVKKDLVQTTQASIRGYPWPKSTGT